MRIVTLEEHFTVSSLVKRIDPEVIKRRGFVQRPTAPGKKSPLDLLPDFDEFRLPSMDTHGISTQVISISGPAADLVHGAEGVALAREFNDGLAAEIKRKPGRYAGFAHLPLLEPEASAKELERAVTKLGFVGAIVNGTIDGLFLDDARFEPVLAAAEALDVPIYLHPHLPPPSVHQAYYGNLPGTASIAISTAGWGWHSEVAIHTLRLCLSGALDRHPKLKVVIGHMGEMLPVMMARFDDVGAIHVKHLKRKVSEMLLDQVWLTTSGIFTEPPFIAALMTFGIDRIMYSVDYPYARNEQGAEFLAKINLPPADMQKLLYGNADKLLKLKPGA